MSETPMTMAAASRTPPPCETATTMSRTSAAMPRRTPTPWLTELAISSPSE